MTTRKQSVLSLYKRLEQYVGDHGFTADQTVGELMEHIKDQWFQEQLQKMDAAVERSAKSRKDKDASEGS